MTFICLLVAGLLWPGLADDKSDALKKEIDAMQGEWIAIGGTRDGEPISEEALKKLKRIIKGNTFEVILDGKPYNTGTFTLDITKSPKQVDIERKGGEGVHGIYEWDGKNYKICYGSKSKPRPAAFESKAGTGIMLMTWKKAG